jgi:hypothetical protein
MFTNHHSRITIHKQAKKRPARQHRGGLTATDDPTRIGILSDHREPKELSSGQIRKPEITLGAKAKKRLTATFTNSKTESTYSKQTVYENSTRNKNAHPPRTDVQPESASAEESRILRSGRIRGPKDLSCGPKWEYASSSQILIYGTGIRNRSKVLKT